MPNYLSFGCVFPFILVRLMPPGSGSETLFLLMILAQFLYISLNKFYLLDLLPVPCLLLFSGHPLACQYPRSSMGTRQRTRTLGGAVHIACTDLRIFSFVSIVKISIDMSQDCYAQVPVPYGAPMYLFPLPPHSVPLHLCCTCTWGLLCPHASLYILLH
jgi:hypothetical protein